MKRKQLQRDFRDCGVSCLAYLIDYYHGYVSIETLREDTNTDAHGTSAYDLVETLKKYHFDAYGMRVEKDSLNTLFTPFIAHLSFENGLQHFVVVTKVKKNRIEIMDPAKGFCKESMESFLKVFDRVVIMAYPYQRIPVFPKEKGLGYLYLHNVVENRKEFFLVFICELCFFFLQMVSQFYVKVMYQNQSLNAFSTLSFYFLICILFQGFFSYEKEKIKLLIAKRVDLHSLKKFFLHIAQIPLHKYLSFHEAELLKRVEEAEELKNLFSGFCVTFAFEFIFSFLSLVFLFFLNQLLFFVVVIGLGCYLFLQFLVSSKIYYQMRNHIDNETNWKETTLEYIQTLVSAKHVQALGYLQNKMNLSLVDTVKKRHRIQKKLLIIEWIKSFSLQMFVFFFLTLGIFLLYQGKLTLIDFLTIQNLFLFLIRPFQSLSELLPKWYYFQNVYRKINEFISLKEENTRIHEIVSFQSIRVNQLCFGYVFHQPILSSLSFQIEPFEHVFLKGKSGSGKSSLCKILMKEMNCNQGEVWYGDYPSSELGFQEISLSVAYLSQREHLFLGTIRENILFGSGALEKKFLDVCRICHVDDILKNKKMSYDSTICEETVSQGEKERILLARILLRDVQILLLDEPLGNVEESMEKEIIQSLREFLKEKTMLYISHRSVEFLFDKVVNLS